MNNEASFQLQQHQRRPRSLSQMGNPPRAPWLCVFSPVHSLCLVQLYLIPPQLWSAHFKQPQWLVLLLPELVLSPDGPPTCRGAKPSQHPSGTHPSVRGYRERGHISPPSVNPTYTLLTHTWQIPSFMNDFIYKQDPLSSLSRCCYFCGSEIALGSSVASICWPPVGVAEWARARIATW